MTTHIKISVDKQADKRVDVKRFTRDPVKRNWRAYPNKFVTTVLPGNEVSFHVWKGTKLEIQERSIPYGKKK